MGTQARLFRPLPLVLHTHYYSKSKGITENARAIISPTIDRARGRKRKLRLTELPFNAAKGATGGRREREERREGERSGGLRDSFELFRSIVTLITGDRLQLEKRRSIRPGHQSTARPPISCSFFPIGRARAAKANFGRLWQLVIPSRWIDGSTADGRSARTRRVARAHYSVRSRARLGGS